jgi:RNA polymerase sigma-70 factor (ECF subfamily)
MATQPDRRLKRQTIVDDLAELEVVYRAEYTNLVRSLTLLAGSRESAADAVQDAFVVAGTRWRDISSIDRPVAWIRTIAARKLLDSHRRSTRWRALAPGIARDACEVEGGSDPSRHSDLLAAVSALPHQQRAVVVLYYLADWTVDDVAAALRVAPGTVKSSLFDARQRLRTTLFEEP